MTEPTEDAPDAASDGFYREPTEADAQWLRERVKAKEQADFERRAGIIVDPYEAAAAIAEDRLAGEERSPYANLLFTRDELAFLHALVQERIETRGLSPEWNAMRTYLAEAMYHLPELPADAKPRQDWERRPIGDGSQEDGGMMA